MKIFLSVFTAILGAASVIWGVHRVTHASTTPANRPLVAAERQLPAKPRIVLRSFTEIGAIRGAGELAVSVVEEHIDYAEDDAAARQLPAEARLATFTIRLAVTGATSRAFALELGEVAPLMEGVGRLPIPFIAHSDKASAHFRFRDRLTVAVTRDGKKNRLEVTIDEATMSMDPAELATLKQHLKTAMELIVSRDKVQRATLAPTRASSKPKEPTPITVPPP
jgi:hypothetical protein